MHTPCQATCTGGSSELFQQMEDHNDVIQVQEWLI